MSVPTGSPVAAYYSGPNWNTTTQPFSSADASGAKADVTAAPTKKLCVDELVISVGSALTVSFYEESVATAILKLYMAANTTVTLSLKNLKLTTAAKKLQVQTSGAGNIAVTAITHEAG